MAWRVLSGWVSEKSGQISPNSCFCSIKLSIDRSKLSIDRSFATKKGYDPDMLRIAKRRLSSFKAALLVKTSEAGSVDILFNSLEL